uniref:Uncharacterized protein n=1 Tax=Meloidogyne enterolobii TaxID=390850 RepID=A0A6V7UXP0_MELEN|nr:unnamed protein product [Meloidogyne enterolobii]
MFFPVKATLFRLFEYNSIRNEIFKVIILLFCGINLSLFEDKNRRKILSGK